MIFALGFIIGYALANDNQWYINIAFSILIALAVIPGTILGIIIGCAVCRITWLFTE